MPRYKNQDTLPGADQGAPKADTSDIQALLEVLIEHYETRVREGGVTPDILNKLRALRGK